MTLIGLRVKVLKDILLPALEEDRIKEVARQLGFQEDSLTQIQANKLYNVIMASLIREVEAFMNSEEALQICRDVRLYSPGASFIDHFDKNLRPRIRSIFPLVKPEPRNQTRSLFGRVLSLMSL